MAATTSTDSLPLDERVARLKDSTREARLHAAATLGQMG
jgi:hypothetical protein